MDHYGNIGFLNKDIPVVASPITLSLMKGIQGTYQTNPGAEVIYINERKPKTYDDRLLVSGKYYGRHLFGTKSWSEDLEDFLWTSERKTGTITPGTLNPLDSADLPFSVIPYDTDHSVYGSNAYILEGDCRIAYTGDIRIHGKRASESMKFIEGAKNVDVLIIEGTRLTSRIVFHSEEVVLRNCRRAVELSKGLVFADFSPRNLERLELFKQIADQTDRQLVVSPRTAYLLKCLEKADDINHLEGILLYKALKVRPPFWETKILAEQEEFVVDSTVLNSNINGYILCFSLNDAIEFHEIKPEQGIYIYSSTGAFKTEQEFDFLRLNSWIKMHRIRPIGFEIEEIDGNEKPTFTEEFHASGHASKFELEYIINKIDPEIIIPVHTENRKWFKEKFGDRAKILERGEKLNI
jgi:ribonuclease J